MGRSCAGCGHSENNHSLEGNCQVATYGTKADGQLIDFTKVLGRCYCTNGTIEVYASTRVSIKQFRRVEDLDLDELLRNVIKSQP